MKRAASSFFTSSFILYGSTDFNGKITINKKVLPLISLIHANFQINLRKSAPFAAKISLFANSPR